VKAPRQRKREDGLKAAFPHAKNLPGNKRKKTWAEKIGEKVQRGSGQKSEAEKKTKVKNAEKSGRAEKS